MEEWEKCLIRDGFDRSPMLKETLIGNYESSNKEMLKICIETLAARAGMRQSFIEEHIEEIVKL